MLLASLSPPHAEAGRPRRSGPSWPRRANPILAVARRVTPAIVGRQRSSHTRPMPHTKRHGMGLIVLFHASGRRPLFPDLPLSAPPCTGFGDNARVHRRWAPRTASCRAVRRSKTALPCARCGVSLTSFQKHRCHIVRIWGSRSGKCPRYQENTRACAASARTRRWWHRPFAILRYIWWSGSQCDNWTICVRVDIAAQRQSGRV